MTMTAAPSRANSFASAAPCPDAAPVISATFPASLKPSLQLRDGPDSSTWDDLRWAQWD